MSRPDPAAWDERFAGSDYLFGTEPNAFLAREAHRISPAGRVLAVADGEGRNGVWLAQQGFAVHSIEGSPAAVAKAVRLADDRGVPIVSSLADLRPGTLVADVGDVLAHPWPQGAYDAVVAIFIQFARPDDRVGLFQALGRALAPGGVLLLEGYHHRQLAYGTGGPPVLEMLYDEDLLRGSFDSFLIDVLDAYDVEIEEGKGHRGMSAVIDLIARAKPAS